MIKEFKIKKEIKRMRKSPINGDFLGILRVKLKDYAVSHPVRKEAAGRLLKVERLNFKYMPAIIIALIVILSSGGVTLASQNSLPGDALYGVKILTEDARLVLATTPEAEVAVGLRLASKRIEEIQKILAERGVEAKGLDKALSQFEKNMAAVAAGVEKKKAKGKDASALAKKANDGLDVDKENINRIIEAKKEQLENEIEGVKKEIKKVREAGDTTAIDPLEKKLAAVKTEKDLLEAKGDEAEERVKDEEEKIEKEMEIKEAAVKAIDEAKKEAEDLKAEIIEKSLTVQEDVWAQYNDFMAKAEEALANEHYVQARQHAKQAKDALKHVEKALEKNKQDQEEADADKEDEAIESDNMNEEKGIKNENKETSAARDLKDKNKGKTATSTEESEEEGDD